MEKQLCISQNVSVARISAMHLTLLSCPHKFIVLTTLCPLFLPLFLIYFISRVLGKEKLRIAKDGFPSLGYDANGNLIEKNNIYKTEVYTYTDTNRMKQSIVYDHVTKTKIITQYSYDALGRRTIVRDEGTLLARTMRTVYDGLGFDVIREQECFASGTLTSVDDVYIDWRKPEKGKVSRYRYIEDDENTDEEETNELEAILCDKENYILVTPERSRSSITLFAKGEPVATNKHLVGGLTKRSYFGTDILGSVRSSTYDDGVTADYYEYDIFGKPLNNTAEYGYTGKPYDQVTGMYNYGYRDYTPRTARFTTVDPVRDGHNWYAYCVNDPVNFVDLWGLKPDIGDGHVAGLTNYWGGTLHKHLEAEAKKAEEAKKKENAENLLASRARMGEDGVADEGPCLAMSLFGIAQTRTGQNMTADQVKKGLEDLKGSELGKGAIGDPDPKKGEYYVNNPTEVINYALELLGSDERAVEITNPEKYAEAQATIVSRKNRSHHAEGDASGNIVWDPLRDDGITDGIITRRFKFEKKEGCTK